MKISGWKILAVLAAWAGTTQATIVNFDDLTGHIVPIPAGYAGLQWNNFDYLDGIQYATDNGPNGYTVGMVSQNNVAFNAYGDPAEFSGSLFDFYAAYLTGAWNEGLNIRVLGYNGLSLLYDTTVIASSVNPTLYNFNYLGVTRVRFESFGGVQNPNYAGGGAHFAMDNLYINERPTQGVPDGGATALLLALATAGLGVWKRRLA